MQAIQEITNVVAMTLSMFLATSASYAKGVEAYQKQDHAAAIVALTRALNTSNAPNALASAALYLRSRSHAELKDTEQSLKDMRRIIKIDPAGPFAPLIAADYRKLTGKKWDGPDLSSPARTWQTLLLAGQRRNVELLKACVTGEWLAEILEELHDGDDFWQEFDQEISKITVRGTAYNKARTRAALVLNMGRSSEAMLVEKEGSAWRIAGEMRGRQEREFPDLARLTGEIPSRSLREDMNKLRQLAAAVTQFEMVHKRYPKNLLALADYTQNLDQVRVSAIDGKPFVYVASAGEALPWIHTKTVVNGQRLVAMGNKPQRIAEADFQRCIKEAGLRPAVDWRGVEASDTERTEIAGLIQQLGAAAHGKRSEAYAELRNIGAKAGQLLDQAARHDDPEIAFQAKELLSEL